MGHGGRMGCPFGESSLRLFSYGESGVTMWVVRVAWVPDKGVLPSAPFHFGSPLDLITFSSSVFCGDLCRGDCVGHGGRMGCLFGESSLRLFSYSESGVTVWVVRVAWVPNKGVLPSAPSVLAHHWI